jgi:alkanesulfonate monooxygenase SsuD/methylene tetrahydromethanopterin reductase-like flavin-dependent oxidoreductase (luciferase family)
MRFSIAPAVQRLENGRRVLDVDGFLAECRAAEDAGWFGAYSGEKHRGDTSYTTSPLHLCGFGLARTEHLLFGTCVSVLPIHHPVSLAEDAAVLDALFPGRFRLTVGAGYFSGDFEPFGVDIGDRDARMVVGMEAINAFRRGEPYVLDGGHWAGTVPARDAALGPDRLEVFIGAWSVPGVRRAAQAADGWITDPIRSGRWIAHLAEIYREECAKLDKDPRIVLFREAWLGDSDAAARETYGPHVLGYSRVYFERGNAYSERFDPWLADVGTADRLTLDHVLPDRVLCGSPATWLEQIEEWQVTLQPEEMLVRLRHFQGPTLEQTLESIGAISTEVLPKLR